MLNLSHVLSQLGDLYPDYEDEPPKNCATTQDQMEFYDQFSFWTEAVLQVYLPFSLYFLVTFLRPLLCFCFPAEHCGIRVVRERRRILYPDLIATRESLQLDVGAFGPLR